MQVDTLVALGEPTRFRIVELLRTGPHSVGEIADRLGVRQPQASKHLKVLSNAHLLRSEAVSRRRIYAINDEPFRELAAWVATFEDGWQARLDSLGAFLEREAGQ